MTAEQHIKSTFKAVARILGRKLTKAERAIVAQQLGYLVILAHAKPTGRPS